MAYGDLKVRNLIWNTGSGDNTVVLADIPPKNNPTFTGTVTVPTATAGDNSTKAASTAFVVTSFAPKASPTFTGTVTVPTATANDNSTKAASTAYVQTELGDYLTTSIAASTYAPLSAPTFTGTVNAADLVLSGDLTVNGTTTTINTQTLDVEDKNIVIGKVSTPTDTTADGGGWTLKGATDKTFNWVNATDAWTSSEHIHVPDDKKFLVGGASGTTDGLEIYHSSNHSYINDTGTGALKIVGDDVRLTNAAGNNILKVNANVAELFHTGNKKLETTSGGINVTGAINVNGSALAGGNTINLVADGAIAAGKPVIIKSNGKAEEIKLSGTATDGVSSSGGTQLSGSNTWSRIRQEKDAIAYDSESDLICYAFRTSSSDLKCVLLSTSGTDFTSHGHTTIKSGGVAADRYGICAMSGKRFVAVYTDGTRTRIKILPVNSSNDGFDTLGSEYDLDGNSSNSSYYERPAPIAIGTNRIAVLSKADNANCQFAQNTLGVIIGDLSGTAWTFRKAEQLGADNPAGHWDISHDSTNNVAAAIWDTSGNQRMMAFKVATDSAAAVTEGSTITVKSGNGDGINAINYHANSGSWITAWRNYDGTNSLQTNAHTINSSSLDITSGTAQSYESHGRPDYSLNICISDEHHIYYIYAQHQKYVYAISGTVSGTAITLNTSNASEQITNYGGNIERLASVYMSHNGKIAYIGKGDGGVNDYNFSGTGGVVSNTSNLTAGGQNFLGVAEDAISDGATGTIKLEGNVAGNQSSLTPGSVYYWTDSGTITSGGGLAYPGGLAVAADKILIRRKTT